MHRFSNFLAPKIAFSVAMTVCAVAGAGEMEDLIALINEKKEAVKQIDSSLEEKLSIKETHERAFQGLEEAIDAHNTEIDSYERERQIYESDEYHGTCNGTVPEPTYNWCVAHEPEVRGRWERLKSWLGKLDDAKLDLEGRELNLVQREENRVSAANQLIEKQQKLNHEMMNLMLDLSRLREYTHENKECVNEPTNEAVVACMNRLWDGVN